LTSRISLSESQNARSITTAIFFPHRLIVGTLICNCGISRFGPDDLKSGRRWTAGKGTPGPLHSRIILKSFSMLLPEKYTA